MPDVKKNVQPPRHRFDELKSKNGKNDLVHIVFDDKKEVLFRRPNRNETAYMLSLIGTNDVFGAVDVLFENCFLAGDKEVQESVGHLVRLGNLIDPIVGVVAAEIKN